MSRPLRFGSAVSAIVLASMLAGCATPEKLGLGARTDGDVGLATRALAALNSNDVAMAVDLSERAVAKSPDDAGFRALLGNAYFAAGRFQSAETAYKDSLTIYSNQPQVVLKLALVQIALGKNAEAVAFLNAGRSVLDPANYGLALALAGRTAEAIPVLETAAREPNADSRIRQNLALAHALAGDWTEARTIAAQDVPANELDARIHQWMQLARPGKPSDQVAAVVGVTPAAVDAGQPIRLALRKTDAMLAQAASAPAAPAPSVPKHAAPVVTAAAAQATVAAVSQKYAPQPAPRLVEAAAAPAELPKPVLAPAPVAVGAATPKAAIASAPLSASLAMLTAAAREVSSAVEAFLPKKATPAPKPTARAVATAAHRAHSNAVMQIGSYRSPQQVAAGWSHLTQRYPALRAYLPMRARFDSANGTFWRLSVQGFDSEREAIARCDMLKSRGGHCFVRGIAGDAPVEIASR